MAGRVKKSEKKEAPAEASGEKEAFRKMMLSRKESTEKFRGELMEFLIRHQDKLDKMFNLLLAESPRDAARFMTDIMKFVIPGLQTVDSNKKEAVKGVPEWKKKIAAAKNTIEEQ